jgi:hypothetical protein
MEQTPSREVVVQLIKKKQKAELSRYTPWRRFRGEEV